jgi:hypothetical protein
MMSSLGGDILADNYPLCGNFRRSFCLHLSLMRKTAILPSVSYLPEACRDGVFGGPACMSWRRLRGQATLIHYNP